MAPKRSGRRTKSKKDNLVAKMANMTVSERENQAEHQKSQGNEFLAQGMLEEAIKCYSTAIDYNPANHVYYSNRSAAHLLNKSIRSAIQDAEQCITMSPSWPKGYSRLGAALHHVGQYRQAAAVFTEGLEKDPQNAALLQGLKEADAAYDAQQNPELAAQKAEAEAKAKAEEAEGAKKGHVIGIDLGTTFSCVGVWKDDGVTIIPGEEGNLTTPSIVAFTAEGERLVGDAARRQAASNPANTVYDAKRILGSKFSDAAVQKDVKDFAFKVIEGEGDKPVIQVEPTPGKVQKHHPEQISAMVLSKMKAVAENFLGESVHRAVITVPAYFNDAQRQATKDAGAIAGLEVMRIINEPTAAALAYGLDRMQDAEKGQHNILVFDLGGGTFDVSLLSIDGGIFEVKATAGDTHLGGEDFDNTIQNFLIGEFERANKGVELTPRALKRLRVAAEQAKRALSSNGQSQIVLDSLVNGIDFQTTVTKAKFDKLNEEHFKRCIDTVKRVLTDAKMKEDEIHDIVLVGGSTRIPKIQKMLSEHFGGKDLCKSINPDEAVAYGAAVQGAILSGRRPAATEQLLLVDVTALSLGIELEGKVFSTIIPRNTAVPASRRKTYTTTADYQDAVDVVIFEGERQCTDGNNLLGEFKITGIERAKRGVPQVEVSFNLDTNGILNVTARDTVTGSVAEVTLNNNKSRLSQEQIQQMLEDAEKHKEEDRIRVEHIEAKNEFEAIVYNLNDSARRNNDIELISKVEEFRAWIEESAHTTVEIQQKKRQLEKLYG